MKKLISNEPDPGFVLARLNLIEPNYTKALVIYDRAIGNILTRNNIELEKQLPAQLTSTN